MQGLYSEMGILIPEILLPAKGINLTSWAVVACDQYTSQPEYWQKVEEDVGDNPSTLRLIFPEIYLRDSDRETRISNINNTMAQYLNKGILEPQKPGFILIDRSTPNTPSRKGLILAVDLEYYDYRPGSCSLIRATEGTVLDRIPPRVRIRENAPIELPHIMLLIDDPEKTVIEQLFNRTESFEKLYDFDLMQEGGHIRGWKIEDEESLANTADALHKLVCKHSEPLLFAVGDGNHSLAAAKAHWENVKAELELAGQKSSAFQADKTMQACADTSCKSGKAVPVHPARYALVEVVNVHDDGLVFEPIHRVLFGVNAKTVLDEIKHIGNGSGEIEYTFFSSSESMEASFKEMKSIPPASAEHSTHLIRFILEGKYGILTVKNPRSSLEAGTLQSLLDCIIKKYDIEIDYIHGSDVVTELGSGKNCMGFYLPVMDKHDLFKTVLADGVLPRKTFSMGEAWEKRYYIECRKII